MKRIGVLLAALLVLTGLPFYAATAESSFTGVVTYRSGKEAYLQNGSRGLLAFLDSTNDPDQMAAVRVGTVITVSGESMTLNQAGYHIPELFSGVTNPKPLAFTRIEPRTSESASRVTKRPPFFFTMEPSATRDLKASLKKASSWLPRQRLTSVRLKPASGDDEITARISLRSLASPFCCVVFVFIASSLLS